jgi:hypothetical protein
MYQLNMDKYREELFNCIEPILKAYGMKKEELNQLQNELLSTDDSGNNNNILQGQTTLT